MFPIPHTGFMVPYNTNSVLPPPPVPPAPLAMNAVGYLGQKELSNYVTRAPYPTLQGFLVEYKSLFYKWFISSIRSPQEFFQYWATRFTKMCYDNGIQPTEAPMPDIITMKLVNDIYTFIVYLWDSGHAQNTFNNQNNNHNNGMMMLGYM